MNNHISHSDAKKLTLAWRILRIVYGLYWGVIGVDKFFGILTESENRVSQLALSLLPISLKQFLHIIGVVEILISLLILTKWPRIGAYCGILLMALIVLNLITMGDHYDIAIHGTTIGIGMIGFILLTDVLKK